MQDVLTPKRIHIIVPVGLLEDIDQRAKAEALSRSDYIRISLMERMDRQNMLDFPPSMRGLPGKTTITLPTAQAAETAPPEYAGDPEAFFWPKDDAYFDSDPPAPAAV